MLLIGSRIQEYRKKAGLNQEEFAEKMGVSRQAVSKWERDKAYPDLDGLCVYVRFWMYRLENLYMERVMSRRRRKRCPGMGLQRIMLSI